jgi:FKBP-type peptidyl-prolyl cis-trans isomerase
MLVFGVKLLGSSPARRRSLHRTTSPRRPRMPRRLGGLAYKVLQKGKGATSRRVRSVTVHYTGWTTDSNSFDSSVKRGAPAVFGVSQVIEGWTEGG